MLDAPLPLCKLNLVPLDAACYKRKVLWVATDEVAFGFMDALVPGSVAMYPSEKSVSQTWRSDVCLTMGCDKYGLRLLERGKVRVVHESLLYNSVK